jgi:hypothetical protein
MDAAHAPSETKTDRMSDIIIRAENIGKRYVLNHQTSGTGYRKFSDVLVHAAKAPLRWLRPSTLNSQLNAKTSGR